MKSPSVVIAATKNVLAFPLRYEGRGENELAFLPAALEIAETPPSPIGRAIAGTIAALSLVAFSWAALGQVDIVASAMGKIVPSGRVKLIQPYETGVVRAIHIRDGQKVEAGQILIELNPTMTVADEAHVKSDLIAAQLDVARLQAALSDSDDPEGSFHPPESASSDLIAMQRHFLAKQVDEFRAKLASLDSQRAQKEAENATVAAGIGKLEASEPLIQQRVEIQKALADKGLGSKLTYLESLQSLTDNQQEQKVQRSRLNETRAAIAALTETRVQEAAEFRSKLFSELTESERKVAGLSEDLVKAKERTKLQLLTAPVSGVVQQLSVHTVGGVVTPAQQLAVIVPADTTLEIEATVSNRDIGFVHSGQDVQIKVDTFDFTRYGLLQGKIIGVSQDAVIRDTASDRPDQKPAGSERRSSEPNGQELNYIARISLDRTDIQVGKTLARLSPGMAVIVEIKTGTRSVLSYLLSPLMKYTNDVLRER